MKTHTKEKILALLKEKGALRPHDIINNLSLNYSGVFRHLRDLQKNGKVYKVGKAPNVHYYLQNTFMFKLNSPIAQNTLHWAESGEIQLVNDQEICPTRDIFQARSTRLLPQLQTELKNENLSYLLLAVIDEIGNNSYDHNLGNWRDTAGALLFHDTQNRNIILSDRGQGIFKTISKVRPNLKNDEDALHTVFTEIVSGRAPEQRGNGLKFVRKIIEQNNFALIYFSGDAVCEIVNGKMTVKKNDFTIPGIYAVITY